MAYRDGQATVHVRTDTEEECPVSPPAWSVAAGAASPRASAIRGDGSAHRSRQAELRPGDNHREGSASVKSATTSSGSPWWRGRRPATIASSSPAAARMAAGTGHERRLLQPGPLGEGSGEVEPGLDADQRQGCRTSAPPTSRARADREETSPASPEDRGARTLDRPAQPRGRPTEVRSSPDGPHRPRSPATPTLA